MVSNTDIDSWVRAEYRRRYCNADGIRFKAFKAEIFRKSLNSVRPGSDKAIQAAVDRLDNELYKLPHQRLDELVAWVTKECSQKLVDKQGLFCKKAILIDSLARKRPEYHPRRIRQVVNTVEKSNIARATNARKVNGATSKAMPVEANSALRKSNNSGPVNSTSANDSSKITQASQPKLGQASIKQVSHKRPVTTPKPTLGSVDLGAKKPSTKNSNGHAQFKIHPLENFQFQLELGNIPQLNDTKRLIPESTQNEALSQKPKQWDLSSFAQQDPLLSESSNQATSSLKELFPGPFPTPFPLSAPNNPKIAPTSIKDDLLSRNLKQLSLSNATRSQDQAGKEEDLTEESSAEDTDSSEDSSDDDVLPHQCSSFEDRPTNGPSYRHVDLLLADGMDEEDNGAQSDGLDAEIQHAPLISGQVLQEAGEVLPQYGFLGTQATSGVSSLESRIFLNTNVPFSAFICGVQGSGKSHTTSCILENALIPSRHLGHLKNPLSALVFSYGEYSSSAGFNISEAAFLAAPHSSFPLHPSVKKITIMVSPSNPAIKKLYNRIPNVTVIPFKLKPRNFDIGTMLTLMAVNESNAIPLYMAQVTNILRDMATVSEDGFDYQDFKVRLKQCEFNPAQLNMLEMRLGLLESFLDLSNSCPEPRFQPGEVTIMDMSCPFIDANTACILFKIGLKKYLESSSPGKMIVLDEAHKYMLKTPGSKALTDYLLTTIRLQRHFGARVVISTQEPTLLTDLIALCSITIIHRFTSPDWFAALKKHIPISNTGEEKDEIMSRIEKLRTGTALVYASNAVLRRNGDGGLEKGTGRLMSVRVRKRVTADGGQSVVAV